MHSQQEQHGSFAAYLLEERDSSPFAFYHNANMEQYIASPELGHNSRNGQISVQSPYQSPNAKEEVLNPEAEIGAGDQEQTEPYTSHYPHLALPGPIPVPGLPNFNEASSSYWYPSHHRQHPSSFHPYSPHLRSHRSPPTPLSPPLSGSPDQSSRRHSAQFSSPTQPVSPTTISPFGGMSTMQLSDASPHALGWAYSTLPSQLTGQQYSNPHFGVTPPTGLSFFSEAAYVSNEGAGIIGSSRKVPKPRMVPRNSDKAGGSKSTRKEERSVSVESGSNGNTHNGGLGFSADIDAEERIPLPTTKEDIRKARIESEQRRRDELRAGYDRLREVLPPSNQRPSKAFILDHSVATIQQLRAALNAASIKVEKLTAEVDTLKATNQELIHTVASQAKVNSSNKAGYQ